MLHLRLLRPLQQRLFLVLLFGLFLCWADECRLRLQAPRAGADLLVLLRCPCCCDALRFRLQTVLQAAVCWRGVQHGADTHARMQVLTWSAYARDNFAAGRSAQTVTATLNVATGAVSEAIVTNTNHDMFCPGISMTGSGSIVVTGGDTSEKTSIWRQDSIGSGGWVPGPNMNIPRGYQASCTLSDGTVRLQTLRISAVPALRVSFRAQTCRWLDISALLQQMYTCNRELLLGWERRLKLPDAYICSVLKCLEMLILARTTPHEVQVFTVGGSWSGGEATATFKKLGEIFSGSAWRTLTGVDAVPMSTADSRGAYRADNHMWLYGWSGNRGVQPPACGAALCAATGARHTLMYVQPV